MAVKVGSIVLWLLTLPYYWSFERYSLDPIIGIFHSRGDLEEHEKSLVFFVDGKRHELVFINIASTLSAAATVGAFSWQSVTDTIWIAQTSWYCSLLFAVFALILSAQQTAVLDSLPTGVGATSFNGHQVSVLRSGTDRTLIASEKARPSDCDIETQDFHCNTTIFSKWNTIYIWQCPMMLMAWSWVLFILALTFHIGSPLVPWLVIDGKRQIAIIYLVVLGLTVCNFAWCSFWIYRSSGTFGLHRANASVSQVSNRHSSKMSGLRYFCSFEPAKEWVKRITSQPKSSRSKQVRS